MNEFKRIAIVTSVIVFTNLAYLPVKADNFSDINNNYWAFDQINTLSNQNIIAGYSDNKFRPDAPVTRAEFATMIIKTLDKENEHINKSFNFRDVSPQSWAYNNIQKAYSLGLITGYPDGTFRPDNFITKTQVLAILANTVKSGQMSNYEAQNIVNRFTGANNIPSWAIVPVAKTIQDNIIVNYPDPNNLYPDKKQQELKLPLCFIMSGKIMDY